MNSSVGRCAWWPWASGQGGTGARCQRGTRYWAHHDQGECSAGRRSLLSWGTCPRGDETKPV